MSALATGEAVAVIGTAVVGVIGWAAKHWLYDQLHERLSRFEDRIDERTYPIQPGANGGNSLPDAIAILTRLESRFDKMDDRLVEVGDTANRTEAIVKTHLDWHNAQ